MDWAADVSSENRPGRHLLDGCAFDSLSDALIIR
jgi:hypothetical protein